MPAPQAAKAQKTFSLAVGPRKYFLPHAQAKSFLINLIQDDLS